MRSMKRTGDSLYISFKKKKKKNLVGNTLLKTIPRYIEIFVLLL